MRGIGAALQFLLLATLSGCAGGPGEQSAPTPEVTTWQSRIGRNHALAGRIWEPATKSFIDREVLLPRLQSGTYILLGEKHDNEDHHRLQAWIVENLVSGGRRPAIAMEMLDADQAAALSGYLSAHPTDAGGIGTAVGWDQKGWPAWPIYAPIVQPALNVGAPILPANLSRSTIKSVAKSGVDALGPAKVAALRLRDPLPPADHARMRQEIIDSHCQMLPETMIDPMVTVLKSRDAHMASVLVTGADMPTADSAVLVTGGGHVRNDHGVPWHLRRFAPGKTVKSLTFLEVRDGEFDPGSYSQLFNTVQLPFDYVWFTPRVEDVDPCEKHATELRRLRKGTNPTSP